MVVHVRQSNHSVAYEKYAVATLTLTGCTHVAISPSSGSSVRGVPVVFTASGVTGCPNPVYQFYIRDTQLIWHKVQAFSSSSGWTWNNAGWGKGSYRIVVWTNQAGSYLGRPQTYAVSNRTLT